MMQRAALIGLVVLSLICHGTLAHADGRSLDAFPVEKKPSIDGLLREWPRLTDLDQGGAGGRAKAQGLVAYDNDRLYVVMDIKDDQLRRSASYGGNEDVARLLIGFPSGKGHKVYRVDLFAGDSKSIPGAVRVDGANVKGARLVEAPKDGGYTFEAQIPWNAFPEARRVRVGLTAALQYVDQGHGTLATAVGSQDLPPLTLEAEYSVKQALLKRERLGDRPQMQVFGDVAGDSALEKVAVYGRFLVIVGSGYRGGKEFYFQDLGPREGTRATSLELMDLNGDGKDDIVLQKRVTLSDLEREIFQIWSIDKGKEQPFAALSQEVALNKDGKKVENRVRIEKSGSKSRIRFSQAKADDDLDPKAFEMSGGPDLQPALMPWDVVQSRAFEWTGRGFAAVDEEKGKPRQELPGAVAASNSGSAEEMDVPPPPRPPTPDEMLNRVYALYKNEHQMGNAKPRFDFVTDVAADRAPERVLIHDRDVVVFGKHFQDGASYVYLTIGVEDPKDITGATAFDVTGDGKAEVIVYAVLRAKASKNLGGATIERQVMFIYGVRESGIRRLFAAETGRSLGENSVLGRVRFLPGERGRVIELGPGQAVGWQQDSYPFPPDRFPYGGFEPLLLPWTDMPVRRYQFDGERYNGP